MSVYLCPHCQRSVKVIPLSGGGDPGGQWERGQRFDFAVGPGRLPKGASEYARETPAGRTDNLVGGLRLPAGQAAITGVVAFALASVVAVLRGGWQWWEPVIIGVVVGCVSWFYLLLDSRRLLRTSETVTADPSAAAFSVEITLPPSEGKKMLFAQFSGCKPEHLRRFATAAIDGIPTPEGAALSRAKFNSIRDEGLRRGLVRWRDAEYHTTGLRTTSMGKVVFQRLLDGVLD